MVAFSKLAFATVAVAAASTQADALSLQRGFLGCCSTKQVKIEKDVAEPQAPAAADAAAPAAAEAAGEADADEQPIDTIEVQPEIVADAAAPAAAIVVKTEEAGPSSEKEEEKKAILPGVFTPTPASMMASNLGDGYSVDAVIVYNIGESEKKLIKGTPIQAMGGLEDQKIAKGDEGVYNPEGGVSGFLVGKTDDEAAPKLKISQLLTGIPENFVDLIVTQPTPAAPGQMGQAQAMPAVEVKEGPNGLKIGQEVTLQTMSMPVLGAVDATSKEGSGKPEHFALKGAEAESADGPKSIPVDAKGVVVAVNPSIVIAWDVDSKTVSPEKSFITAVMAAEDAGDEGAMRMVEVQGMKAWYGPIEKGLQERMVEPLPMSLMPAPMGAREVVVPKEVLKPAEKPIGIVRQLTATFSGMLTGAGAKQSTRMSAIETAKDFAAKPENLVMAKMQKQESGMAELIAKREAEFAAAAEAAAAQVAANAVKAAADEATAADAAPVAAKE